MPHLLFVVTAAGGLDDVADAAVAPLVARGWTVQVVPTPNAQTWLRSTGSMDRLAELTDLPVTAESDYPPYRTATEARPDAAVVAPASFGTLNKLAAGIGDNRATTKLNELFGIRPARRVVILPNVNAAHVRHPAWEGSRTALLAVPGLRLLLHPDVAELNEPGEPHPPLRWDLLLDAVGDPSARPG
jgi:hypothetical protein